MTNLQLAGKRMLGQLKSTLTSLIVADVLEKPIERTFADTQFLQSLLLEITQQWAVQDKLEVFTTPALKAALDEAFSNSIHQSLRQLTLHVDQQLEGGFRILEKEENYQITFTDQGFIELFRSYLREETRVWPFTSHKK